MTLKAFSQEYKTLLELELIEKVSLLRTPDIVKDAMIYSLKAGGKRIRPLLLFATLEACGKDPRKGLSTATAIEMIHTYSLIHDDLPSMDDDDLRRGKPTNHKVFGEAMAILAGDALLTYSFQVITQDTLLSADEKVQMIEGLARAAGTEGMVGGQVADIEGESKQLTIEELEYIHTHKTGKLLEFSVLAAALLANATQEQKSLLLKFAYHLGLAFQIRDDILDIEGSTEQLGKTVGSDISKEKSTYPALLSMDGAKHALQSHINDAKAALHKTGLNVELLEEILNLIASRDH